MPEHVELNGLSAGAVLGAIRLGSAALPVGAFAYSQGLEQAVFVGAVHDVASATRWVNGVLSNSVLTGDVPLLLRLRAGWLGGAACEVRRYNDWLYATRPTRELRHEERQLGSALFRLLSGLGEERARPFIADPRATLGAAFALAAVTWGLSASLAAVAYCFAWAEAQVGAATRLIPLGQTDAQRALSVCLRTIDRGLAAALEVPDDRIAHTAPGQAVLSALHETQYSRLFRS